MNWFGVIPAITTPFYGNLKVDHPFLAEHAGWLLGNGCAGLVLLGSLGEGATLEHAEKIQVLQTAVRASESRKTPVIATISSLSTHNAVMLAKQAENAGCDALMVLPPYVYASDWREMKHHVSAVIGATSLPCMLYNNPVAYKTDFLPDQIAELAAQHANLEAIKESSADVRRVAAIRAILSDRLTILVGVDDAIVEGVHAGAQGWVAGLANAFPAESVELFNLAQAGRHEDSFALHSWFLPLLRMDTVAKFVQLIKWVQSQTATGSARVRPPRLELEGTELADARRILSTALANRPAVQSTTFPPLKEA